MGEGKTQKFQDLWSQYNISDGGSLLSSSSNEDSTISNGSFSFNDIQDDASSSSATCSSSSNSSGDLYDLSELMSRLPIKRGLSKFYQGKSESFTCLSRLTSIEDLAKKEAPLYRKKYYKGSKNFEVGLDSYKLFTLPKPIISKKTPRGSFSSSFPSRKRGGSFINGSNRPPQIPLKKSLKDGGGM
ncbi:hypothetical protein ACH5RR_008001 [Cinchona calisaya]|uniref:Oxidative stress 3 n=1 Tax=Cinchona calisaya TaxID=153742 RepID=A0ABD3ABW3_9GENT